MQELIYDDVIRDLNSKMTYSSVSYEHLEEIENEFYSEYIRNFP